MFLFESGEIQDISTFVCSGAGCLCSWRMFGSTFIRDLFEWFVFHWVFQWMPSIEYKRPALTGFPANQIRLFPMLFSLCLLYQSLESDFIACPKLPWADQFEKESREIVQSLIHSIPSVFFSRFDRSASADQQWADSDVCWAWRSFFFPFNCSLYQVSNVARRPSVLKKWECLRSSDFAGDLPYGSSVLVKWLNGSEWVGGCDFSSVQWKSSSSRSNRSTLIFTLLANVLIED